MRKSRKILATLLLASATLTCATSCTDAFGEWLPSLQNSSQIIEHTWVKAVTLQEATCNEKGIDLYACTDCGITKIVHEDALTTHDYINKECIYCGKRQLSEGLKYTLSADETYYTVTGIGTCTDTYLVIPSTYEGKPVRGIGDDAFYTCTSLTSVIIPDSVTSIGNYAFYNCTRLTSVVIGNSVTSIAYSAFGDCYSLTSVVIPNSVETIGDYAFYYCTSLTSVVIGNSVTSIGNDAFYNCNRLTNIVIPDSVTGIGYFAFAYCTSLTSVEIPNRVTSIGDYAFSGCDSLTSITVDQNNKYYQSIDGNLYTKGGKTLIRYAIGKTTTKFTIPNSVETIGNYAFEDCNNLAVLVISDSVIAIDSSAFSHCNGLMTVVIGNSVTSIDEKAFDYCTSLTRVYYKGTASDWAKISIGSSNSYLTNATRYYYSEKQPTEEGNYWHYDKDGKVVVW